MRVSGEIVRGLAFEVKRARLQRGEGWTTKRAIPRDGPAQPSYIFVHVPHEECHIVQTELTNRILAFLHEMGYSLMAEPRTQIFLPHNCFSVGFVPLRPYRSRIHCVLPWRHT